MKPREYWINFNPLKEDGFGEAENVMRHVASVACSNGRHVIEKKAFDELLALAKEMSERVKDCYHTEETDFDRWLEENEKK